MSKPIGERVAFITGVTGQDGSHLAEQLLEMGYKSVVGLRRRTSAFNTARVEHIYTNPRFYTEWGNMSDGYSLWRILNKCKPDEIYNLAAQSHVKVSFEVPEETMDVVAGGTLRLLNAYKEVVPKARFYQASSSEMFGDNVAIPQNEETKMTPVSPYAAAKLCAHNLCRTYREGYGLHISCGILFNHEGPRRGETFVTRKITQAAARIKLGMQANLELGNLEAMRDWGWAPDYTRGMWQMLQQDKPDDYVLATGETHSVREFLEEVFKLAGLRVDDHLVINERLFRPHEVPLLKGDYAKAKEKLGWAPSVTFKDLAKLMFEADFEKELAL